MHTVEGKWKLNSALLLIITVLLTLLFPFIRASSISVMKDNMEHRQHSPLTALEWDSYPFSDGDWSPSNMYGPPIHSNIYIAHTSRETITLST